MGPCLGSSVNITEDEKNSRIQIIEEVFNYIDDDGSNKISLRELQENLDPKKEKRSSYWEGVFKDYDKNKDGFISREEFIERNLEVGKNQTFEQFKSNMDKMLNDAKGVNPGTEMAHRRLLLLEVFEHIDDNNNGAIDLYELQQNLDPEENADIEHWKRMFKAFDMDKDGKISKDEWVERNLVWLKEDDGTDMPMEQFKASVEEMLKMAKSVRATLRKSPL